jgi:hypothetical protein
MIGKSKEEGGERGLWMHRTTKQEWEEEEEEEKKKRGRREEEKKEVTSEFERFKSISRVNRSRRDAEIEWKANETKKRAEEQNWDELRQKRREAARI